MENIVIPFAGQERVSKKENITNQVKSKNLINSKIIINKSNNDNEIVPNKILNGIDNTLPYSNSLNNKSVPARAEIISNNDNKVVQNNIILPPRSEIFLSFKIKPQIKEMLCASQEVQPGVYIGNITVPSSQDEVVIPVVNANHKSVEIKNFNPHLVPLSTFCKLNIANQTNNSRIKEIIECIQQDESLNHEERYSLFKIVEAFHDVFHLNGDVLTRTDIVKHNIPLLQDTAPINIRQYRLPESQRSEINSQIDKLLQNNINVPSSSPWNAPLLLVPKKSDDNEKKMEVSHRLP